MGTDISANVNDGYYNSVTGTTFSNAALKGVTGQDVGAIYGSWYRFTTPPDLTGATILEAHLVLTHGNNDPSENVLSKVMMELSLAAANPTTAADARGRTRTASKIDWDTIPAFVADTEFQSPDLKVMMQEVVNLGTPTIYLVFHDDDGSPNNTTVQPWHRNGSTVFDARLEVWYEV